MRLGALFSAVLDPTKPPLFGDIDLRLLPREVWHPSATGEWLLVYMRVLCMHAVLCLLRGHTACA